MIKVQYGTLRNSVFKVSGYPFKKNKNMIKNMIVLYIFLWYLLKEVQYNCSTHRSAHLFIIAISSHSHINRKQPQRTFLHYSCSVTMINIVKKYLLRKIHKLNTLIDLQMILSHKHRINIIVKNRLLQNNDCWLFPQFCEVLHVSFRFFRK